MREGILLKIKIIPIAVFVVMIAAIPLVQADFDWSAPYNNLNSDYRVTTDRHGEEVLLGESVTAWAGTLNTDIDEVKFRWINPNAAEVEVPVTDFTWGEWEGQPVKEFSNTQTLVGEWAVVGEWGVQGIFYDHDQNPSPRIGPIKSQPDFTAIRARSFHVIPEAAFGTIAILIAMFGALGIFAVRRKRVPLVVKSL